MAESLYYDGVLINTLPFTNTNNTGRNLTYNVNLGVQAAGTAPNGTTFTRYWNGLLDEVEMSNVSRTPAFIKLQYATQKAGLNAVTLGSTIPNIPGFPTVTTPANQSVTVGATARFKVTATGSTPLTYKWVRRNVDTVGTNADSLILNTVTNADTGSYKCVVRNSVGQAVSGSATLAVLFAPSISQQPSNQSVSVGATVKFGIVAAGSTPRTYKWVKNTTDTVAGATTDTLTLANVQLSDSGTYKCVVSNAVGQAVSNAARLTVTPVAIWGAHAVMDGFAITSSHSAITFHLPRSASGIRVSIMDVHGRKVWTQKAATGTTEMSWDKKINGRTVTTGIYFVQLASEKGNKSEVVAESKITLGD